MEFIQERIGKIVRELSALRYPTNMKLTGFRMLKSCEKFQNIQDLDTEAWPLFEGVKVWGGHREYYWFSNTVVIPQEMDGKCIVFSLSTGREGQWDATNPQFSFYVNGKLVQGLDVNHREVLLADKAKAGQVYHIVMSAYTGDYNEFLYMDAKLSVLDRRTEKYYYDVLVPYQITFLLGEEERAYHIITEVLNASINCLDFRQPASACYYSSMKKAQEYLTKELYEKYKNSEESIVHCIGHTHIDIAWLWTLDVTKDKVVRSFSTVLEYMKQYDEYQFMSSQAQLYEYVKENNPALYKEIKDRVKAQRFEVNGTMYVEADCNLASGESLVRQCVYGKRFFKNEFGVDNDILWLPDVFGYSAALPQILQKCRVPYFMTTKISWNETNQMPYDTFYWEGIDGSRVLSHFICTRDYTGEGGVVNTSPEHFTKFSTNYNGFLNPSQVKGAWQRYQQKELNQEVLLSFGYGDGGGGPTKEMLEVQRRLSMGLPGCPQTKMGFASDYFQKLDEKVASNQRTPVWNGELYLEYHRGTYTSMARNKKYNRKMEFALLNQEFYENLANIWLGKKMPRDEMYRMWTILMRNQFHDILPGSSIEEVYEESKREYEEMEQTLTKLKSACLSLMTKQVRGEKGDIVLWNCNGISGAGFVEIEDYGKRLEALTDGVVVYDVQMLENEKQGFFINEVPAKGFVALKPVGEKALGENPISIAKDSIETPFYKILVNEKGQFSSIYDKTENRELLKVNQNGNVWMTYEDKPHNYDAWDINNYYTEKAWEVDQIQCIEVVEEGPIRGCLKVQHLYLNSVITQYIYVYRDSRRIDIQATVDWKETHILLKALFPIDVHSNEATFDIQYGNVKRATHKNTTWDCARFEVCHHKWMDVSEDNYGVSILNDCKYGVSVADGIIGLTLLKSATYPNEHADKEMHSFTYSIYPHAGDWKTAHTLQEAYQLNNPLQMTVKTQSEGELPEKYSLLWTEQENVIIEVVKQAEDTGEIVVRLYEAYNRRTDVKLCFGGEAEKIMECNLLEEDEGMIQTEKGCCFFTMKPYEIKTLKLYGFSVVKA